MTSEEIFKAMNTDLILGAFALWIVASIIVEESMNAIFTWRFYKDRFAGSGLKTPIVALVSLVLCAVYKIDLFAYFVSAVGIKAEPGWFGYIISALLLSGGSGTAFRVMERLRKAKGGDSS